MAIIDLANPTRFLALTERLLPLLIGVTALAFAAGLVLIHGAPDDRARP
jgi:heme exporter protein C